LPCPRKPLSTVDIMGCLEQRIVRTDHAIDRDAQRIFRLLPEAGGQPFVSAEKSWFAYRRSACRAEASIYFGGTGRPIKFGVCTVRINVQHLKDLAKLRTAITQP
jgi:uncharacterized protein YecT (DUF1311 family)